MKKILLILLVFLSAGSALADTYNFTATTAEGITLYYAIINSTTNVKVVKQTTSGNPYSVMPTGDLVIPSTVENNATTYTVTTIGSSAFTKCTGLTSVTLPNTITTIDGSAFSGCTGFSSITFPSSLITIGVSAFSGCTGLTSITIPDNVTSIGGTAFNNCSNVTTLTLNGNTTTIGTSAFQNMSGLTTVNWNIVNATNNGASSTTYIFKGSNFTTLNIGSNVTAIPTYAFYGNTRLTPIDIPDNVTSIGEYAFYGCSGATYINTGDGISTISRSAFQNCSGATSITIGDNVTSIGTGAFKGCTGATSVSLGNSVTTIGTSAFESCTHLTSISFPASVTTLNGSSFKNCSTLTSVVIPATITSIGTDVFNGCTGITTLTLNGNTTTLAANAFQNMSNLNTVNWNIVNATNNGTSSTNAIFKSSNFTNLNIGNNVTTIPTYAFYGNTRLTPIDIPDNITSIGTYAFYGCSGATYINTGDGISTISNYAFQNCSGAASITIGDNVTSIGTSAFKGCTGATSLSLGSRVATIGTSAFESCTHLPSISFPASVTTLNGSAFKSCSTLTSVVIPATITSIGTDVFNGCTGITTLTLNGNTTTLAANAFQNMSGLTTVNWNIVNATNNGTSSSDAIFKSSNFTTLNIGSNVTAIPTYAFYGNTRLTPIDIPDNVTSIGQYAFYGCTGATYINTGDGISTISNYAFQNCTGATSITIGDNVTSIGTSAFRSCTGATSVSLGSRVATIGTSAFESCTHLTSISFPASVTTLNGSSFKNCSTLTSVVIPENITSIGSNVFNGCTGITTLTLNGNTTTLAVNAFQNMSALTTVNWNIVNATNNGAASGDVIFKSSNFTTLNIGEATRAIPRYAFYGNTSLTTIDIPDYVTSIGIYAFYGCTAADAISTGNGVTSIGTNAFQQCRSAASITIGDAVTTVGNYAFDACTSATDLLIGSGVTSMGTYVFRSCSTLTSITSKKDVPIPTITTSTFPSYTVPLYVPTSALSTYQTATYWSNFYNNGRLNPYFTVTYNGNNATSGEVPTDLIIYHDGDDVTVKGNTGSLTKNRCVFLGWMFTQQDTVKSKVVEAAFTFYNAGETFTIDDDKTLYALWAIDANGNGIADYDEATITVNVNNGDYGSASGGGIYSIGATATLTATPAEHYRFVKWSDESTDNPYEITVTTDATYTAIFERDSYTLTVAVNNALYGSTTGTGTYDNGTSVTITATANPGYEFVQWNDGNTNASRSVTVSSNITYTATFSAIPYTITVTSESDSKGTVSGGGTYSYGDVVYISATPKSGYAFSQWNDANTDNPRSITVTGNATYTAYFYNKYTVSYEGNGNTGGTEPTDATRYDSGDEATVLGKNTLVRTNCIFLGWTTFRFSAAVASAEVAYVLEHLDGIYSAGDEIIISQDTTFYALWAVDADGNGTPDYEQTYTVTFTAGSNGSLTGTTSYSSIPYNTLWEDASITIPTPVPSAGYVFDHWEDDGENVVTSFPAVIRESLSYTAKFVTASATLRIAYHANEATSGSVPTDINLYAPGSSVTVLGNTGSLVKTNCVFLGWSDVVTGLITTASERSAVTIYTAGNSYTIADNTTLYAVWAKDANGPDGEPDGEADYNQLQVLYNSNGAKGEVSDPNRYSAGTDDIDLLEANSLWYSGYTFLGWSDDDNNGDIIADEAALTTFKASHSLLTPLIDHVDIDESDVTLFAIWGDVSVFPIELVEMRSDCADEGISIAWTSATETNNAYYTLSRSEDNEHFVEVARIAGAGTANTYLNYAYTDHSAISGKMYYYKLQQTDFDGRVEELQTITALCDAREETLPLSIYPNPASERVYISLPTSSIAEVVVRIYTVSGTLVAEHHFAGNTQLLEVPLHTLPAGIYYLNLSGALNNKGYKIVVKH